MTPSLPSPILQNKNGEKKFAVNPKSWTNIGKRRGNSASRF